MNTSNICQLNWIKKGVGSLWNWETHPLRISSPRGKGGVCKAKTKNVGKSCVRSR